jgi:hypothetical protein
MLVKNHCLPSSIMAAPYSGKPALKLTSQAQKQHTQRMQTTLWNSSATHLSVKRLNAQQLLQLAMHA